VSGAQCRQQRCHRRRPGHLLEEYLRFQAYQTGQRKVLTGAIDYDVVYINLHSQGVKAGRPIPSSLSHLPKRVHKKTGDGTYNAHEIVFLGGLNPLNTNIISIAAPRRAEGGTDGNMPQKDLFLLVFSRARWYRESGILSARMEIDPWSATVKDNPKTLSEVTCPRADSLVFWIFKEVRVAHWDALCKEYSKPR